ncbi:MAG: oligosaccharide repeat unit polymerase [Filimonas sp.]|nr:oligosaccharide repeat unit polymerase [Filimonas sp.]
MILLLYFIFFLLILLRYGKKSSIALILVLLQIISLAGCFLINADYPITGLWDLLNLGFVALILTVVISPWINVYRVKSIDFANEKKVKRLTYFLLIISFFVFIVLIITSILVFSLVQDINEFKYADGVSTDFYYQLPINVKLFILSTYLYNFSYFLIPLHFFYLSKEKWALSILCLIFSLNIVLYGLTYFSRSVFVHYLLIYISFLYILYNALTERTRGIIKKVLISAGSLFAVYFVYVTIQRFTNDTLYANTIPAKSFIQEPVLYSCFDYLSQWYYNGMYILHSYKFTTFQGQISLQPILSLLGQYGIIGYDTMRYANLRQQLWPLHWFTFNGLVGYSVYDYGYILTLFFSFIYYYIVKRFQPKAGRLSLIHLFYIVLLIQIPLMAIFYSAVAGIIVPFLLMIPIGLYLKIRVE